MLISSRNAISRGVQAGRKWYLRRQRQRQCGLHAARASAAIMAQASWHRSSGINIPQNRHRPGWLAISAGARALAQLAMA